MALKMLNSLLALEDAGLLVGPGHKASEVSVWACQENVCALSLLRDGSPYPGVNK